MPSRQPGRFDEGGQQELRESTSETHGGAETRLERLDKRRKRAARSTRWEGGTQRRTPRSSHGESPATTWSSTRDRAAIELADSFDVPATNVEIAPGAMKKSTGSRQRRRTLVPVEGAENRASEVEMRGSHGEGAERRSWSNGSKLRQLPGYVLYVITLFCHVLSAWMRGAIVYLGARVHRPVRALVDPRHTDRLGRRVRAARCLAAVLDHPAAGLSGSWVTGGR